MEFISQEQEMNCYMIASFMEMFMKSKSNKNDKWIKILGDFWVTIKDLPLEELDNDSWNGLGELIEYNLIENWKNDWFESQLMEDYIFPIRWHNNNLKQSEKFKKYVEYFQQRYKEDEEQSYDYYDDSDNQSEYKRKLREDDYDDYDDN